jgi:hypothetical protein
MRRMALKMGLAMGTLVKGASIIVTSLALALAEPPPETLAWLVSGEDALAATLTVTKTGGKREPPFTTALEVQVLPAQLQPVPDIATNVSPVGRVSEIVTTPLVGPAETALEMLKA